MPRRPVLTSLPIDAKARLMSAATTQEFLAALKNYMRKQFDYNTLPGQSQLAKEIAPAMARAGLEDFYPRLQELVTRDRLQLLQAGTSDRWSAARHETQLPTAYWQAVLEQANDPEAWAKKHPKPLWANQMIPLETKGDYLRALRNALQLDANDVALDTGHTRGIEINRIENTELLTNDLAEKNYTGLALYYADRTDLCHPETLLKLTNHRKDQTPRITDWAKQVKTSKNTPPGSISF